MWEKLSWQSYLSVRPQLPLDAIALVTGICLIAVGCNRQLLSAFFDLPPEAQAPDTARAINTQAKFDLNALILGIDTVRPPIEATLDPDSVKALLPRDHAGNIDWMEALRTKVIKPRSSISGKGLSELEGSFQFAFDFYLEGPNPMFDAYFPHSAHTQWLQCQQCHPRIFPKRGTEITMAQIFQGKFCAECHGKVAFPVATGCERCHTKLVQPADRAQPELIGDITLKRVRAAVGIEGDSVRSRDPLTNVFPEATFSHWVHRARFRCKVCHMDIFEPEAGANEITMERIKAGEACGHCHNGKEAFDAGFGQCLRCHVPPRPAAEGS